MRARPRGTGRRAASPSRSDDARCPGSRATRSATCSARWPAAYPDAIAYVEGDEHLTFAEWVDARRLARRRAHRARACRRATSSRSCCRRRSTSRSAYASASRLGAVATGINTAARPHRDHGHPRPRPAHGAVPRRRRRPRARRRAPPAGGDGARRAARARGTRHRARPATPAPQPDDPACIVWTSGTTGTPKGAWFDHRALRASAGMSGILSVPFDVRSMPVPFAHAGYMNKMWDQLAHVITCVLPPGAWTAEGDARRDGARARHGAAKACRRSGPRCSTSRSSPTPTCRRCGSRRPVRRRCRPSSPSGCAPGSGARSWCATRAPSRRR